ncbi:membrane associated rhomboid family serine protease [Arthrobacter sp. CAN_A214]|uniref:rhomboid family intramembrane serine protease n=1 Tax=Arthrobacter sp. CAN_A214 TaxID=2787720 RepID=UPI0018C984BD
MLAHRARTGLLTVGILVAVLWAVFFVNLLTGHVLTGHFAIEPRRVRGLDGILFAPLLHGGLPHLVSNSLPLLVLGFLTFLDGLRRFVVALGTSWLVSGLGVWILGGGLTIGASGVVFGLFAYLIARGFYNRNVLQILLAGVVFLAYGSILWGVLPVFGSNISWQAHLFGAIGGVAAALILKRRPAPSGADRLLR